MAGKKVHADDTPLSGAGPALRRRAEALDRQDLTQRPDEAAVQSPEAMQRLSQELRVHQIELEMQNEELRRAQAELETSRALYVDLYDRAPVGYCTLDKEGTIRQANLTAASLLGTAPGSLVTQPIQRFILQEDHDTFSRHSQQLLATGELQTCDLRMVNGDGTTFWARLRSVSAQDADGTPLCRVAFDDVTESKRMEEALREQKEFFHLIAENLCDFIAVLDLEGRRLYNSPSYKQFFGSTKDLRNTDSFADIHPDDQARVKQVFRETVQTGQGRLINYRFMMADGSVREMESRGSVIKDSEGRVVRVVVVSHDITARKRLEEQVHQMAFHDALTRLPNRRLFNDRLNQALAASTRSACYGALIFLDLDNFKPLNDQYGHEAGDLLLIEAADRLKHCVREMDTVARFGGDEFVVMLGELDQDRSESVALAETIAEKLRVAVSEPYVLTIARDGKGATTIEFRCTASIGVALFNHHDASQGSIVRRADSAMYQAKLAGGNQLRFCEANG